MKAAGLMIRSVETLEGSYVKDKQKPEAFANYLKQTQSSESHSESQLLIGEETLVFVTQKSYCYTLSWMHSG